VLSGQDWVNIIAAVAAATVAIMSAIGVLWVKVHSYQAQVNGRMDQLLELTRTSARAAGKAESPRKYPPDWTA